MTQAVCMICGGRKFGALVPCPSCEFTPRTILDLTLSMEYSDRGKYARELDSLSIAIKENLNAIDIGDENSTFSLDRTMIDGVAHHIHDPSWRDMLTLKRSAKDGLFKKRLNVHEIGPDGYHSFILERGTNIEGRAFDAVRSVGDGDMYVTAFYEKGEKMHQAISKDKWYVVYDKMLLVERAATMRSKMQEFYDSTCEMLLDMYLTTGKIDY